MQALEGSPEEKSFPPLTANFSGMALKCPQECQVTQHKGSSLSRAGRVTWDT